MTAFDNYDGYATFLKTLFGDLSEANFTYDNGTKNWLHPAQVLQFLIPHGQPEKHVVAANVARNVTALSKLFLFRHYAQAVADASEGSRTVNDVIKAELDAYPYLKKQKFVVSKKFSLYLCYTYKEFCSLTYFRHQNFMTWCF